MTQRMFSGFLAAASLTWLISPAMAEVYPLILRGKVMMKDGSPPPKAVSIQRICSDDSGSAPGPLTDKKGEFQWRIDVDPMRTRVCHLEAFLPGYVSSRVDISALNGYTSTAQTLPPFVLTNKVADPYTINESEKDVPGKSAGAWKAAMKAVDAGNAAEAIEHLDVAVKATPKFAAGWNAMGIIYQSQAKQTEAKDAFQHAIEADPKLLGAYVGLTRMCIATKDWQCALSASEGLIRVDTKRIFPEIYLHQAVAQYGLKNLDAAQASAQEAMRYDQRPRNEYVMGRILEAKGDIAGAREHMTKYLATDVTAPDLEMVKKHIDLLGKPEASTVEPNLE